MSIAKAASRYTITVRVWAPPGRDGNNQVDAEPPIVIESIKQVITKPVCTGVPFSRSIPNTFTHMNTNV